MSLYLCIFEEEEIAGWVFGHYSDFGYFREVIAKHLGTQRYPALMQHSDSKGEWTPAELGQLRVELQSIAKEFKRLPAEQPTGAFEHTIDFRRNASRLYDCFHNVDGENIFEALLTLCSEGIKRNRPVLLQ